ncbi:uncharacterized protein [Acropora muricata]|uniref:uncharacterized protein n=1 Tax=Acropora muricata TaxID=159855 RepID=UPI0034E39BFF
MEDSGESDVFSERDEWSVSFDSYDEIEFEDFDSFALDKNADKSDDEEGPYSQEPLANDQWLQEYQQERRIIEARERELQNRMDRVVEQDSWCKCGNCHLDLLQNANECQCCQGIDGCKESLNSELVLCEVNSNPNCVILHPGFYPVCLNRWSLRSAAAKYRAQDGTKYRQTGTETEFLRATAYREFTQLVHGYLGARRIPLPACAYHAIRKEFSIESEHFNGYEHDDE